MSTLRVSNVQLGQSGTATQNFTVTAAAADGTMKLARGNAGATTQDILSVNASGQVDFPQGLSTQYMPLGVGQTWQNVTASRAYGTTYTNSTGRPILVALSVTPAGAGSQNVTCFVSGVNIMTIATTNGSAAGNGTFIVPAGATYSLTATNSTLVNWSELR